MKIQKSKIVILVLNQFPISAVSNSAVCWEPKNRTNRGIPVIVIGCNHEKATKLENLLLIDVHINSSISAQKLRCSSSAQLGKFQLELITAAATLRTRVSVEFLKKI